VVDELLIKLKEAGFLVFGYADDVAIVIKDNFLNILKEHMDEALRIIRDWCMAVGLTINLSKTTAMIFTRKYKPKLIGSLKLWGKGGRRIREECRSQTHKPRLSTQTPFHTKTGQNS